MRRILFVILWCGLLSFLMFFTPSRAFAAIQIIASPSDTVKLGDQITLTVSGCGAGNYPVKLSYHYNSQDYDIGTIYTYAGVATKNVTLNSNGQYIITAVCKRNGVEESGTKILTINETPPDSPTILNGSADSESIFIRWNKVSGANRHEVYFAKETDRDYTGISEDGALKKGDVTEYHITQVKLVPDTRYLVYVKACNNNGCSPVIDKNRAFAITTAPAATPTPLISPTPTPTPLPAQAPCTTKETVMISGQPTEKCSAIRTDFGDIPTDPAKFITRFFGIVLGIAGGIAVLLILYSGYRLIMSEGDPERIKGARETITSAIIGLLFIIFSFVVYQIVANDILRLNTMKP